MVDNREYDVNFVKRLLREKRFNELALYMKEHNLKLEHNLLVSCDRDFLENNQKLKDLSQYVKKIVLNSSYGATLNSSCVSYDFRLGASTTLSGRLVTKHMAEEINYNTIKKRIHKGGTLIGGDTDSEKFDTVHRIKLQDGTERLISVEDLYQSCKYAWVDERTGKEYGFTTAKIYGYDDRKGVEHFFPIRYVYRHKTHKQKWEIEDENGNIVTVTEDHSCMVERNGDLVCVKPREIREDDILITTE